MKKVLLVIFLVAILVPWTSALAIDSSQYLVGAWSYCGDSDECYVRVKIVNPNLVPVAVDIAFFDMEENFCGCVIYPSMSSFSELEFPVYAILDNFYLGYSFYGGPLLWGGGEFATKCSGIAGMMAALSYKPCTSAGLPIMCKNASVVSYNAPISGFATLHDDYRSSIAGMSAVTVSNSNTVLTTIHSQCYSYIQANIGD